MGYRGSFLNRAISLLAAFMTFREIYEDWGTVRWFYLATAGWFAVTWTIHALTGESVFD